MVFILLYATYVRYIFIFIVMKMVFRVKFLKLFAQFRKHIKQL